MRTRLIFGYLIFFVVNAFSQPSEISIQHSQKIVGRNFITEDSILGTQYILPDRIFQTYIDTIGKCATFQVRGVSKNEKWLDNKGEIIVYDLLNKNIKWSKTALYQISSFEQYDNHMIQTDQNKSFYLDYNTGEKLWKVKNQIYLANPIHNIALGYKYSNMSGLTNLLEGINLADGSVIWEREIDRDYGWQYLYYFNDSTLLLAANGLHTINIKNGSGWDYHTEMGIQKSSIGFSVLRDVKSNLIIDSLNIFCASGEKLFKLHQQDGSEQWSFALPVKETGKSRIFIEDSTLFMINFGHAYMGYRQVVQGTPYIAAFNKHTGENKYFNIINVKKDPVQSLWTKNDTLILAFSNRLEQYSLNDGKKIYEKTIDTKKYGELLLFVGYQTYIKTSDNKYEPVPGIEQSNNYLLTENQKVLVLDEDFNPLNEIDQDSIFIHYSSSRHYKFIANEDLTVVLDADNFAIAEFTSSKNSVLIDKMLFSMYKENFLEVDLSGLIFD